MSKETLNNHSEALAWNPTIRKPSYFSGFSWYSKSCKRAVECRAMLLNCQKHISPAEIAMIMWHGVAYEPCPNPRDCAGSTCPSARCPGGNRSCKQSLNLRDTAKALGNNQNTFSKGLRLSDYIWSQLEGCPPSSSPCTHQLSCSEIYPAGLLSCSFEIQACTPLSDSTGYTLAKLAADARPSPAWSESLHITSHRFFLA